MRSVRRLLPLLILGLATSWAAGASAADVKGVVRSVDPRGMTLVVAVRTSLGSTQNVIVSLTDQTEVTTGSGTALDLSDIQPGAPVVIREGVLASSVVVSEQVRGNLVSVDEDSRELVIRRGRSKEDVRLSLAPRAVVESIRGDSIEPADLRPGSLVVAVYERGVVSDLTVERVAGQTILEKFWDNFRHNLFKPLLLFFYMGFLIPILGVKFEFPYVIYQGLTIYLLIAIGWHGGEELAGLDPSVLSRVVGFMGAGFVTNTVIGFVAYVLLRALTRLRRIDAATVAGYYGSDSAGTFVTCLGVLTTAGIAFDAFMPVMLAVMEIPGCLVALFLVSTLRNRKMDPAGNMPDEPGYAPHAVVVEEPGHDDAVRREREMALERRNGEDDTAEGSAAEAHDPRKARLLSPELLREVLLNPGIYLLFGGILVGYISRSQGPLVTKPDDPLFLDLFQGLLCLFLLEMGMTASRRLRDLRSAGWRFILFGILCPPMFATVGILVAHAYSWAFDQPFQLGTYVLFSVLCAAASYIAVPAVQRLAIPEASPTLPLAASLGLTFTFNVTIGIPVYIAIAEFIMQELPVG